MTDNEIIKCFELCALKLYPHCDECLNRKNPTNCKETLYKCTFDLINRQKAEIEQEKLIKERDVFREYAYNMQKYVENIKHKEDAGYEPSVARYAAEMDMWRVVALEKKKLADENERLQRENEILSVNADNAFQEGLNEAQSLYAEQIKNQIRAEAVKEFTERLRGRLSLNVRISNEDYVDIAEDIDNLVKEFTEGENNEN